MILDQLSLFEQENLQQSLEDRTSTTVREREESEREYWERYGEEIAKVGLIHYPVTAREILSRLRKVGYYVGPYSRLSNKEQKELLKRKRQEIRCVLAKYLPAVLRSIDQMNRQEYNQYFRIKTERR